MSIDSQQYYQLVSSDLSASECVHCSMLSDQVVCRCMQRRCCLRASAILVPKLVECLAIHPSSVAKHHIYNKMIAKTMKQLGSAGILC